MVDLVNRLALSGPEVKNMTEWDQAMVNDYLGIGDALEELAEAINMIIGSTSIDAFGRLRTSEPTSLFDSKQIHNKQPDLWDEATTGAGATGTWSQDAASTLMGVTTAAGSITRQTFRRFNYQPGKSQLIFMTFVLRKSGGGAGITTQVGVFDDNNGIFLQDNQGVIEMVRRTSASGGPVDNTVAQTAWSIDRMNGTGPSGVTVDWTKSQILIIDYEWLGVGRVRTGLVVDGAIYYVHEFLNANVLNEVYMSTPNLPLRYLIDNDGTGVASSLEHICASVISEGGADDLGVARHVSCGTTVINGNTAGTIYAVIGIKLRTANIDGAIKPIALSTLEDAATSVSYEWLLLVDPVIANRGAFSTPFTDVDSASSTIQYAVGDSGAASTNTVTGGVQIAGSYASGGGKTDSVRAQTDTQQLVGATIAGTPQELWLCVRPMDANGNFRGSLSWKEIS